MPDTPTNNPACSRWIAYRFSLRGLLIFTLGIATGLGIAKLSGWFLLFDVRIPMPITAWDWFLAIRVAIATWLAVGLLEEVRDLWLAVRKNPQFDRNLRTALRWAILWRCLGAFAAGAYVAYQYASPFEILAWEWDISGMIAVREIPDAILCLIVLAAIDPTGGPNEARQPVWRKCLAVVAVLAAGAWAIVLVDERMGIASLTHRAITTLVPAVSAELHAAWIRGGIASAVLTLISFFLICQLARHWARPGRTTWGVLLVLAIAALGYEIGWAARWGLPRYSQAVYLTLHLRDPSFVTMSGLLIFTFSFVAAGYVLTRTTDLDATFEWRPANRRYCHESAALMMVPFFLHILQFLWAAESPPLRRIADAAYVVAYEPVSLLWLAVFLAGTWRLICWMRTRETVWPTTIAALPAGKLAAIWSATLITVVLAAASFAWLGFVGWLIVPIAWRL